MTPLVTADGTALLVDRGWMHTDNSGSRRGHDLPAPPTGTVTVVGLGPRATPPAAPPRVDDLSTRASRARRSPAARRAGVRRLRGRRRPSRRSPPSRWCTPSCPTSATARTSSTGCSGGSSGSSRCSASSTSPRTSARSCGPACGARARAASRQGQSERSMPPSTGSITPVTKLAAGREQERRGPAELLGPP